MWVAPRQHLVSPVLSGLVGVFILLAARDPATWLRLTAAGMSILASVTATIATSAKWSEKAEQHHSVGAAYGKLHRRLEEALALPRASEEAAQNVLEEVRAEMDALPMKAPSIPNDVWHSIPDELTPSTGLDVPDEAEQDEQYKT